MLAVVLYHANLGIAESGYLGVDIFFVVSGYVIALTITSRVNDDSFSLTEFYARRALRLLPASCVTVFFVGLLSPFFVSSPGLSSLGQQVLGALTYSSNLVLWQQADYFDGDAQLKPLLHYWSLSLEEQYYLIFPLIFLYRSRSRLPLVLCCAGFVASLSLCLIFNDESPVATFYLMPTRAWELAFGALCYLCLRNSRICSGKFFPLIVASLLVLCLLPSGRWGGSHPGLHAIVVCLLSGGLLVLGEREQLLGRVAALRPLSWLGDVSYSLYLIHWPIFAFMRNAYLGELPWMIGALVVPGSVIIAAMMHYKVERPLIRIAKAGDLRIKSAQLSMAFTCLGALALVPIGISEREDPWVGLDEYEKFASCNFYMTEFDYDSACKSSGNPKVLIWGDSYARHLTWGLARTDIGGIVSATMNNCGPAVELALPSNSQRWAEACFRFQESVLEYIESESQVETVIISSLYSYYVGKGDVRTPSGIDSIDLSTSVAAISSAIERIRASGRNVILVSKPPVPNFDAGECVRRELEGRVTLGRDDCKLRRSTYFANGVEVEGLLQEVSKQTATPVLWLSEILCAPDCKVSANAQPLYQDSGHLSFAGSVYLAENNIGSRIASLLSETR